ncbi:hypothetical protein ACWD4B_13340 [Streptomyces sp. NPDC002536]
MSSMQSAQSEGERPPRYDIIVAAIAVGYGAGYSAGIGNEVERMLGAVVVTTVTWIWDRWSR